MGGTIKVRQNGPYLVDADGHLCAHGTGTFKYVRALPAKGREIKPLQRRDNDKP